MTRLCPFCKARLVIIGDGSCSNCDSLEYARSWRKWHGSAYLTITAVLLLGWVLWLLLFIGSLTQEDQARKSLFGLTVVVSGVNVCIAAKKYRDWRAELVSSEKRAEQPE